MRGMDAGKGPELTLMDLGRRKRGKKKDERAAEKRSLHRGISLLRGGLTTFPETQMPAGCLRYWNLRLSSKGSSGRNSAAFVVHVKNLTRSSPHSSPGSQRVEGKAFAFACHPEHRSDEINRPRPKDLVFGFWLLFRA